MNLYLIKKRDTIDTYFVKFDNFSNQTATIAKAEFFDFYNAFDYSEIDNTTEITTNVPS